MLMVSVVEGEAEEQLSERLKLFTPTENEETEWKRKELGFTQTYIHVYVQTFTHYACAPRNLYNLDRFRNCLP